MATTTLSVLQKYKNGEPVYTLSIYGKSTENKPTDTSVGNASAFVEMDTGKVYLYDEDTTTWLEWGGQNE